MTAAPRRRHSPDDSGWSSSRPPPGRIPAPARGRRNVQREASWAKNLLKNQPAPYSATGTRLAGRLFAPQYARSTQARKSAMLSSEGINLLPVANFRLEADSQSLSPALRIPRPRDAPLSTGPPEH